MPNYDFGSMTYPNLSNASVEYYYDANGNLIKNLDKGIVSSRYNFLNLADTIQFQNGNQIINSYLADGRKVGAAYKTYMTGIMVPLDSVYHGMAPYTMAVDEWDGHYMYHRRSGSPNYTPEGYIGADHVGIDSRRNYAYYYYVHDHLGNVRITSNSQEYYVDQSLEYYPSGVLFDRSTETYRQPYMFGGKELVSMRGLNEYDFNARMQDPVIPRFTSMDPLCEKYPWMSGYAYCGNNPVNRIDPDGKKDRRVGPNEIVGTEHQSGSVGKITVTIVRTTNSTRIVGKSNENYGDVKTIPTKVNLSIIGQMRKDNDLIADAEVIVRSTFENGETVNIESYEAVAGGFGNGAPENGDYTVDNYQDRSLSGWYNKGMNKDGIGFSFNLNPQFSTGRTELRIHPDGNNEGTLGCIGLSDNKIILANFKNLLKVLLKTQTSIPTNINIINNPNNDGKNKKKIPSVNE